MRKDMTDEEIALARKWLDLGSKSIMSDETIALVIGGTHTHARIRLFLAWQGCKTEFRKAFFGRFWK